MKTYPEINALDLAAVERSISLGELNRPGLKPQAVEEFELRMLALKDRRRRLLATIARRGGEVSHV